jgi:hypothetical protein
VRTLLALALIACTHAPPASQPRAGPGGAVLSLEPRTAVNDPALAPRGAELRAALQRALAAEGFRVAEQGGLTVETSIDYTPWTSVSAGSLYLVVRLFSAGDFVDQVEVQKINEVFPEAARVDELAQALAHALATSPRLRQFLQSR